MDIYTVYSIYSMNIVYIRICNYNYNQSTNKIFD